MVATPLGVGGDGHSHLAGLGRAAIHHHGIGGLVHDFKRNPRQACVALRGCSCLAVFLLDGQSTTLHFLSDVIGDKFVSIFDQLATINVVCVDFCVQFISGRRSDFLDGHCAKRDAGQNRKIATSVGSDVLSYSLTAFLICYPVYRSCERRISLGSTTSLRISLYYVQRECSRVVYNINRSV